MVGDGGVSPLPREARQYQGRRAGLVTRMVAAGLDGVVVALVLLAGYSAVTVFLFMIDPRGFSLPEVGLLFSMASAFVVLVIYQTLAWRLTGRTYGGAVMGLRVVNHRGDRLRLMGAFARSLFCAFVPIGIMWVAVSPENRSLQDVVLRSSVVYDWQPTAGSHHPVEQ
jgi:uncharacterized RDD family membrane protein YckC